MTKEELVSSIAAETGVTKAIASAVIKNMINVIRSSDKVTLVGFGTFKHVVKPAHEARNPITGEPVQVPEKVVLKFKSSK
jgi:DNA-binding protein HU-beta